MIPIRHNPASKLAVTDISAPEFGKIHTDHLFIAEYKDAQWQQQRIEPFGLLSLSPFALSLHYAQAVFEGMKAFRTKEGKAVVFRPEAHYDRFVKSMERMCIPPMPRELFLEAVNEFVKLEQGWIPHTDGGSLYLRPLIFASEARVGVKIAEEYLFLIMACPSVPMYGKPLRVKMERNYTRAAEGGTGSAKCAGNYGSVFLPTLEARKEGFDQVIWTDAQTHRFIEESGTMNIMMVKQGELITPPASGTILEGITRDSLLTLAGDLGIPVNQRKIEVNELKEGIRNGSVTEIFGTGTAAVVVPIAEVGIDGESFSLRTPPTLMNLLAEKLSGIRNGSETDVFGWNVRVD
jgi:branched-chain amino acid aminotransferase